MIETMDEIIAKSPCELLALGETMLRFTPSNFRRFEQASEIEMHVGGSESNTLVGLSRLGHSVAWLSRLTDNPLGHTIARSLVAHGVDVSHVKWTEEDRVGTYFMERGSPPRGSQVYYDRVDSAMSRMQPADCPPEAFRVGLKLFHTTGITLGISPSAFNTAISAVEMARKCGAIISFDVNYRAKLWDLKNASQCCGELCKQADIIFLPLRDAQSLFKTEADPENALRQLKNRWATSTIVLTAGSAGAFAVNPDGQIYRQAAIPADEVERLGRGDAFSAGFLSARLRGLDLPTALRWASVAAAIKSSIPGDLPVWDASYFDALLSKQAEASLQVER